MDLLERYLQAVRFFLPRHQQDDIVRELSDNLMSQMEDRADELGRPLTEDEQAVILRRHGHPMLVAGRYRSHQQLIGPIFFPIYVFALKMGLGVALFVTVVEKTITAVLNGDPARHVLEAFLAFPGRALMVFAWTTIAFAALDFAQAQLKLPRSWDPRSLPKVVRQEHRIPRVRSLFEFVAIVAGGVWLLLLPSAPGLLLGPAGGILEPAPIWGAVYVPILLLTAASAVQSAINFRRPFWTPARSLLRGGIQVGTLAIAAVLLRADAWVVAKAGPALQAGAQLNQFVSVINTSVQVALVVTCIMSLVEIVLAVRRASSSPRSESAAPHVNGA